MKQHRYRRSSAKVGVLAAVAVLVALCVPAFAAGSATVFIKDGKGGLRFEAPKTVVAGEDLKVQNTTDPHKVGPHTFSLVQKSQVPKTKKQRQLCFTKGHICKAIAAWHGVKGNGPVKVNPVEVGTPGWSTMGSLTEKGDSWFTGEKPGTSIEQPVSADVTAGPTRIYFICAVHPWMHGSIEVLPPTPPAPPVPTPTM